MLDMLDTVNNVSPNKSPSSQGTKEQRSEPRYKAQWRIAVAIEGDNFVYGRIRDISLHGAAILSALSINPGNCVTLRIYMPAFLTPDDSKIITVRGRATYCVHDSDHLCFRCGISFVKFESAAERTYLEDRLASHHVMVPDCVRQRSSDSPITRFSTGG